MYTKNRSSPSVKMDNIKELKKLSYHSYCIEGQDTSVAALKDLLLNEHGIEEKGNPDFFCRSYETFSIDDARQIKSAHEMKPVHASDRKIFIISAHGMTIEAQNALLKLLEEPAEYAYFFLVIPSAHLLLPTIRSRVHLIKTDRIEAESLKSFLNESRAKRLETIKKLVEDISDEKKSRQEAIAFLNEIERAVYEEKGAKGGQESLSVIEKARTYMNDRAPSLKMLLEYVALNL